MFGGATGPHTCVHTSRFRNSPVLSCRARAASTSARKIAREGSSSIHGPPGCHCTAMTGSREVPPGLDHAVFNTARHPLRAVSDHVRRLMVKEIYWNYDGCARARASRWRLVGRILSPPELNLSGSCPYDLRQHRWGLCRLVGDLYRLPARDSQSSAGLGAGSREWLDERTLR